MPSGTLPLKKGSNRVLPTRMLPESSQTSIDRTWILGAAVSSCRVSSRGATKLAHPLNNAFGNVPIRKLKGEDALRVSGLDYTIVRLGGLSDDAVRQGTLNFSQGDEVETGRISRADAGEICAAALCEASARNRTFEVISEAGDSGSNWQQPISGLGSDRARRSNDATDDRNERPLRRFVRS